MKKLGKRVAIGVVAFYVIKGIVVTAILLWAGGLMSWREWRATAAIANPLERDAKIKRALGFGEETFTRLAGLLRRATAKAPV